MIETIEMMVVAHRRYLLPDGFEYARTVRHLWQGELSPRVGVRSPFLSHSKSRCKQSTSFQIAPNVCETQAGGNGPLHNIKRPYIFQKVCYYRILMKQSKYGSPFEVLESALHHTQLQARLHAFAWHVTHQAELYLSGRFLCLLLLFLKN
jgi:hypothetical protein